MQLFKSAGFILTALVGVYLTSLHGYLLFHSLAELFSIVIACGIFMIAWNTRRLLQNHYLLFIGIAYLFVGGIDLLHTLAYKGMGIFEGHGANLPTQFWIAGRYVEAFSLLFATVFLHRKLAPRLALAAHGISTGLLLASILYWKVFPDCFVEGMGLTAFKIYSEYAICAILLAAGGLLIRNSKAFNRNVLFLLVGSIAAAIAGELAFTTYLSVYGRANMIGHLLKIVSFYLLYKAIIETGLVSPCNLLFRELKQSEAKFRSIFETNVVPIAYCGMDGRIIDANDVYLKLLGFTREELKAGTARWDAATPPEWKHMDEAGLEYLRRDGVCPPLEKEYLRTDGTRVPVLVGACLVPGESGQVVAFAVDLTERKKTEEALRESEERYRTLVDVLPSGVYTCDAQGRITFFNEGAVTLWGRRPRLGDEDRLFCGSFRLRLPDGQALPHDRTPMALAVRDGVGFRNREVVIEHPDGRRVHVLVNIDPLRDADGRVVGAVNAFIDVTALKQAEQALRLSEERLRLAKETAGLGTYDYDIASGSVEWDERMREIWGVGPDTPITYELSMSALHPDDRAPTQAAVDRALDPNGDGKFHAEYRVLSLDEGTERWAAGTGQAFFERGGAVRLVGAVQDITERKRMEEALRKSNDELEFRVRERTAELRISNSALTEYAARLERLNEELQEFAWVASHDLQEPLRKMMVFGDRLLSFEDSLGERGRDDLGRIIKSARRMSSLVGSLSSYACMTREITTSRPVDLEGTARDAVGDLGIALSESGGTVEIGELPTIEGDAAKMRLLFQNLISNAIKYIDDHKEPRIRITGRVVDGMCRIEVEDNGIGFEERYVDRIFKPFQRLHGRSSRFEGTGMGLTVCRKVADLHGGTITARSKPGEGSTFIVSLPVEQGARHRAPTDPRKGSSTSDTIGNDLVGST